MKHLLASLLALVPLISAAQESLPVIDFGDNLFWYSTAIPQYRAGTAGVTREKRAEGEFVNGHPFSLDIPLSPVTGDYNTRGNNTRFYGGMKVHCWDNPTNKYSWSEGGSNTEHEGFDDFNFMANALESLNTPEKPGNRLKATGIWLWKKEDFINGGDKFMVTFDETSRVGVFLSRTYPVNDAHAKRLIAEGKISKDTRPFTDTYANQRLEVVPRENWRGWESLHLVVRDGEQFYVAETDFEPAAQTLFEVSPTKVKWAKYNPQGPWDFEFDPKSATFEPHEFKDITAAGWMILKNTIENATLWLKWYGFGMDAVVNRPWEAGVNVPMAKLEGPAGKDGLYMAKSEVTYEQWRKIVRWASRNQWCMHPGYDFDRDGNMGSMLADDNPHSADEPATGMTWYDAVLWCNALSAYEGRTPSYYEDAALTKPLHVVKNMSSIEASLMPPQVHVKWEADGFRLPTPDEWALAAAGESAPAANGSTVPATTPTANSKGFHGLGGNVREFVWDADSNSVEASGPRTVLGGDFRGPNPVPLASGEIPSSGHYAIGFRPVRAVGPAKAPKLTALSAKPGYWELGKIPAWTFGWEEMVSAAGKPAAPEIPMISSDGLEAGKTEITYAQWKPVFLWAEANGYRFANDGDMGSMGWLPGKYAQDEPVTGISLLDAALWTNALSEMKGLKPVYFADAALTQPLKTANPFRTASHQWSLGSSRFGKHPKPFDRFLFHVDPKSDGFRLPFSAEWPKLAGSAKFATGENLDPATAWFAGNSGERTRPVATATPTGAGFHDLTGNVFEWAIENAKEPKPETGNLFSIRVHGGSFRSDTKTPKALTTEASIGTWDWINSGLTSPEIGFRIVKTAN